VLIRFSFVLYLPSHPTLPPALPSQAPSEKPSLLAQEDGPGWSCILYFVIKPDTALAYIKGEKEGGKEGGVAMTAGMKLFGEFMRNAVPVDGGEEGREEGREGGSVGGREAMN